jgi:hypothetical protein
MSGTLSASIHFNKFSLCSLVAPASSRPLRKILPARCRRYHRAVSRKFYVEI